MPQTKKEYAISLGLARPGRGRMSREAHEAITKAVNKGMKFADSKGPTKSVTVKTKENGKTVVKTVRTNDVVLAADPRTDRPEGHYTFVGESGKKFLRLHTEACIKCSMSYRWCYCPEGPFAWAGPGSEKVVPCVGFPGRQARVKTEPKTRRRKG